MAKNSKTGTLVISTRTAIQHDGVVESVSEAGVTVTSREFGRQTKTEKFFPHHMIIAHSDEGEGFVVVEEDQPVVVFHGTVSTDGDTITVETEGGRTVSSGSFKGMTYQVIYDGEGGLTTLGKEGKRRAARFDTKSERSSGSAKKTKKADKADKKEKSKKKVAGKRRG